MITTTRKIDTLDLVDERTIRKARESLKSFTSFTFEGDFLWGWFNELLCEVLQEAYAELEAGGSPRLMIFAPPRTGKSEITSKRFSAWALGKNNKLNVVNASYAASLATKHSRETQRIVESENYQRVFPSTKLNSKNVRTLAGAPVRTAEHWEIVDNTGRTTGGSYRAVGVTKGLSGMGFEIGVIDDPVKDYKEASSEVIQTRVWEWYNTTFKTRRNPKNNMIMLMMTRWHINDLGGKLIEKMEHEGEQWTIVRFPMEAESEEFFSTKKKKYKTRNPGDILFPARMDESFVEECKYDDLTWNCLYQQNPTIKGGDFFKTDWFSMYDPKRLPLFERKIITGDTAQKKNDWNDWSVFALWGLYDQQIFLLDLIRGRWASYELRTQIYKFWLKYGGGIVGPTVNASAVYIEDKVSGTGLIQDVRKGGYLIDPDNPDPKLAAETANRVPCIDVQRNIDKLTRAWDIRSDIQSGFVYLPMVAPWLTPFLMEFEQFKSDMKHPFDDQVDVTMDAIEILLRGKGGVDYSGYKR